MSDTLLLVGCLPFLQQPEIVDIFDRWMVELLKSTGPFVLLSQLFLILKKIYKELCSSLHFIFLLRVPCPHLL